MYECFMKTKYLCAKNHNFSGNLHKIKYHSLPLAKIRTLPLINQKSAPDWENTFCPKLVKVIEFTSHHTGKTHKCINLPNPMLITCEISHIIYLMECMKYGYQYIGETGNPQNGCYKNTVYKIFPVSEFVVESAQSSLFSISHSA